jgi:hypothetical protein
MVDQVLTGFLGSGHAKLMVSLPAVPRRMAAVVATATATPLSGNTARYLAEPAKRKANLFDL